MCARCFATKRRKLIKMLTPPTRGKLEVWLKRRVRGTGRWSGLLCSWKRRSASNVLECDRAYVPPRHSRTWQSPVSRGDGSVTAAAAGCVETRRKTPKQTSTTQPTLRPPPPPPPAPPPLAPPPPPPRWLPPFGPVWLPFPPFRLVWLPLVSPIRRTRVLDDDEYVTYSSAIGMYVPYGSSYLPS
jgi:hypothetical protein